MLVLVDIIGFWNVSRIGWGRGLLSIDFVFIDWKWDEMKWRYGNGVWMYLSIDWSLWTWVVILFWLFIIVMMMMPVVITIVMVLGFHSIFLLYYDQSCRWLEPSCSILCLLVRTTTGVVLPFIPTDSAQSPTAEWLVGITIYYRHPQEISSHVILFLLLDYYHVRLSVGGCLFLPPGSNVTIIFSLSQGSLEWMDGSGRRSDYFFFSSLINCIFLLPVLDYHLLYPFPSRPVPWLLWFLFLSRILALVLTKYPHRTVSPKWTARTPVLSRRQILIEIILGAGSRRTWAMGPRFDLWSQSPPNNVARTSVRD